MACFGASVSKILTLVLKAESAVSLLEGRSVVLVSAAHEKPLSGALATERCPSSSTRFSLLGLRYFSPVTTLCAVDGGTVELCAE